MIERELKEEELNRSGGKINWGSSNQNEIYTWMELPKNIYENIKDT